MKTNLLFLTENVKVSSMLRQYENILPIFYFNSGVFIFFEKISPFLKKKKLQKTFLKKSIVLLKTTRSSRIAKSINFYLYLNKFLLNFLEFFLKSKIIFNLKKGSNRLIIGQISSRRFYMKYFRRNFKITKQILGIIYYALILKDSFIFVNFFKKIIERSALRSHKKIFLGLKKLFKDIFKPLFGFFGVYGIFFNIKGKVGVSGSAKKRRYYFYYGKHSFTTRTIKADIKHLPVWTFTGSLGFTFLIFF